MKKRALRKAFIYMFVLLAAGCGASIDHISAKKHSQEAYGQNRETAPQTKLPDTPSQNLIKKRVYGESLNYPVMIYPFKNATLYLPENREDKKIPLILFAPGWGSQNHTDYQTLLRFTAAQGYAVIYAKSPTEYGADKSIAYFQEVLDDARFSKLFDKSRMGVVGHSSGGGIAFAILYHFSQKGYGEKGRFIFAMDPWFAFGMDAKKFTDFPQKSCVIIQQYGDSGSTDPRIALTIYNKLSALDNKQKDYQYCANCNHAYPFAHTYKEMQITLRPLDALIDYTFNKTKEAYAVALEIGSDRPYEDNLQPVKAKNTYSYRCDGNRNSTLISALAGLDYCSIVP
jgi:acetyl esterase/lipase